MRWSRRRSFGPTAASVRRRSFAAQFSAVTVTSAAMPRSSRVQCSATSRASLTTADCTERRGAGDERGITQDMNLNPDIFKAYDVRGVYPGEVHEEAARAIGAAF